MNATAGQIEKLHKHFVEQRVAGFTWGKVVHHPMSREEAEELWQQVEPNMVEAVFGTSVVRRNPTPDTAHMRRRAAQFAAHSMDEVDRAVAYSLTGNLDAAVKCISKLPRADAEVALINKLEDAKVARDVELCAAIGFLQGNVHA